MEISKCTWFYYYYFLCTRMQPSSLDTAVGKEPAYTYAYIVVAVEQEFENICLWIFEFKVRLTLQAECCRSNNHYYLHVQIWNPLRPTGTGYWSIDIWYMISYRYRWATPSPCLFKPTWLGLCFYDGSSRTLKYVQCAMHKYGALNGFEELHFSLVMKTSSAGPWL